MSLFLSGCDGGDTTNQAQNASAVNPQTGEIPSTGAVIAGGQPASVPSTTRGLLTALSDQELNSLEPVERYRVANKLLATLYSGLSVDEFFNLDNGLDQPETRVQTHWLSELGSSIQTALDLQQLEQLDLQILGSDNYAGPSDYPIEARYDFSRDKPREIPLARIFHYPHSFNSFSQWMSWNLANSILFSPAAELDSVEMTDVQNVFRRIDRGIHSGNSIREIVYEHMKSQENWRRFRSPEDNTREMIEIFLGLENLDEQVPAASRACRDLYLTKENEGYLLAFTDFPNTEPQQVLGAQVVNCDDFYRAVANHENLIPVIARTLVAYFFADRGIEFHEAAITDLMESNPTTFQQLFIPIIFSSEYLLHTERLKSFEEAWLGTAKKIRWETRADTFRAMASGRGGNGQTYMTEMGWPAMSAKLGRVAGIATDSLSFANFHKAMRESLLIQEYRWRDALGIVEPTPPEPAPLDPPPANASVQAVADYNTVIAQNQLELDAMTPQQRAEYDDSLKIFIHNRDLHEKISKLSPPEFIDYLFIAVAGRQAVSDEKIDLIALFDSEGYLRIEEEGQYLNKWSRAQAARIAMDYLSRLPEIYYLKKVGE